MDKTSAQTQLKLLFAQEFFKFEALDEDRNEVVRSFLGILGKCEVGSS
jgi:hypothetical protein